MEKAVFDMDAFAPGNDLQAGDYRKKAGLLQKSLHEDIVIAQNIINFIGPAAKEIL
jgi:hypothetical protein